MGNRWSRMNKGRKRAFAIALATAVASTTLNVGSIAANAGTSARGRVIVAFEELPEDWRCPRCKQPKEKFNKA